MLGVEEGDEGRGHDVYLAPATPVEPAISALTGRPAGLRTLPARGHGLSPDASRDEARSARTSLFTRPGTRRASPRSSLVDPLALPMDRDPDHRRRTLGSHRWRGSAHGVTNW